MSDRKKPLLFGEELGDATARALSANALAHVQDDPNWIPGYSEQMRMLELQGAEYGSMAYQQRAHQARALGISEVKSPSVRFKPLRVAGLNGEINDNILMDLATYQSQGYRPATLADLERNGYAKPPLYTVAADGTIRRGDVALYVVDAEGAKAIADAKFRETKERENNRGASGAESGVPIAVESNRDPNFSF